MKYLKVENEVIRGKLPERITITPKERQRLVKFGKHLGKSLYRLTTIVKPSTLLRWIREEKRNGKKVPAKRGRCQSDAACCFRNSSHVPSPRWGPGSRPTRS